jgi:lipopolysaccharide export system permease protein
VRIFRGRLVAKYIFFEMLPSFVLGATIFVLVLLMFQSLRLTEFVLVHGVKTKVILNIVAYLSVSFLPAIVPMSLLFSVLLTYGRMSSDSEIVVLKSLGLSQINLIIPGLFFSIIVATMSAYTSFSLAPWGNRQFELLVTKIGNQKVTATIREGTFAAGFFDLVVYANKVDSKKGLLEKVFIYDERDPNSPLTIISKRGKIIKDQETAGKETLLRLIDGDIHRPAEESYTKISFESYDIQFSHPVADGFREKSFPSYTLDDLKAELAKADLPIDKRKRFTAEYHKGWAISFTCIVFALLGIGIGAVTHHRRAKAGGMVKSVAIIVIFWALYVASETVVRKSSIPPGLIIWTPNVLFLFASFFALRKSWN